MRTGQILLGILPTERNAPLRMPPGRYLLKYDVDTTGKSSRDYHMSANAPAFYQGQQEISIAWKPGWGEMTNLRVSLQ